MTHLFQRNVILGVCGGIAAYKSAELVRELRSLGAHVRVVMTHGAREFITPLTMQALSGNPVHTELLDERAELGMGHIELARWAELLLIAPATADVIARLAEGRGDDLLTTVALASEAPVLLAPAMNQAMWRAAATCDNVTVLKTRNVQFVGPDEGIQACGDVGPGRLSEPAVIAQAAAQMLSRGPLLNQRVVITAGPTREALDPVRYLSNRSSGKMGFALAKAAAEAGARVTLISGPVELPTPPGVARVDVESALDMLRAAQSAVTEGCELFIGCAAVADYRPAEYQTQKIKKSGQESQLALARNPDIVATVAQAANAPFTVGFAAETESLLVNARAKLQRKGLNMIIANDVSDQAIGFNSEDNSVTVLWDEGESELPRMPKTKLAHRLIELIAEQLAHQPTLRRPSADPGHSQ